MVNIRITFPLLTQSLTKSIDQRSFGWLADGSSADQYARARETINELGDP
jgi:hypothetical protein